MKNVLLKLTVTFFIIVVAYNPCYAYDWEDYYAVEYKVSDDSSYKKAKFSQAKKECIEYKNKTGEKLSYPYVKRIFDPEGENKVIGECFIYDYNDIFDYGYETYVYGIPAIKFNEYVKNPSKEFLDNNYRAMYARKADTGEKLRKTDSYIPTMEYMNSNDDSSNDIMEDDAMIGADFCDEDQPISYICYNLISRHITIDSFLKSKGINDKIIYSCLVYPYDEWEYSLELVPIVWVKTDKNNYFIRSYDRKNLADFKSLLPDYGSFFNYNFAYYDYGVYIYLLPDFVEPTLYTQEEAINEFCFKTGKLFVDDSGIDVNVNFYKDTAMIPLRDYAEKLGYDVQWNHNGTVGLVKNNTNLNIEGRNSGNLWELWLLDGDNHRENLTSTIKYNNSIYFDNGMFYITNEAIKAISNIGGFDVNIDGPTNTVYVKSK